MASRYKAIALAGLLALPTIVAQSPQAVVGVQSPATVTSVIVPPASERSVMFTDRGRTYLVGMTSGRVTVVDGSQPVPGPVVPPSVTLQGLSKQVWDSLTSSPVDAQNRVLGAKALIGAIDSTISEVGGLGLTDCQQIIDRLATNAEAARVNEYLRGWQLGTLLAGAKIATKDDLLNALGEIRRGLEAIK